MKKFLINCIAAKKIIKVYLIGNFLFWLLLCLDISIAQKVCVYFFYGATCPHCAEEKSFLTELGKKYPIELHEFEVYFNQTNVKIWNEISSKYKTEPIGVPMSFIGDKVFIGFVHGNVEIFDSKYNAYIGYDGIIEKTIKEYVEKGGIDCPNKIELNISKESNLNKSSSNFYISILISFLILFVLVFSLMKIFKIKIKVKT
jgi:glutaredoxin